MSVKLIVGAFMLSLAAYFLARGVGLPVWSGKVPGDAVDIAALTFFGIIFIGDAA